MISSETISSATSSRFISKERALLEGNEGLDPKLAVTITPQAVPEPGTIVLLVIGCITTLGAQGLRRMKARRKQTRSACH
jgi:hypothetical protein